MIIKSLDVENIRSHNSFSKQLSPTVTVITGLNGSGKTSLIEAIMIALGGKSFKGTDSELLRHGAPWWRINLKLDNQERAVKYQPASPKKPKEFIVDDKSTVRLPATQKYPVVLFEPDDLRLLGGSPSRRRAFIDRFAGQTMLDYSRVVRRYERALLQRNKLLKQAASDSDLFAWNVSLAKYGAYIVETRERLAKRLDEGLGAVYRTIAQTDDRVAISYSHRAAAASEQALLAELERQTERDRILGYTSVGPHRHDILFSINGTPAVQAASRGEIRTIILALKFMEVDIVEDTTGQKPIILLDDVFSELDEKRQTHLATKFRDHQIIMTSVAAPKALARAKVIRLARPI